MPKKRAEQLFVDSIYKYASSKKAEYEEVAKALDKMKLIPYLYSLKIRAIAIKLSAGEILPKIKHSSILKLHDVAMKLDSDTLPENIYIFTNDRISIMNEFSIFIRKYKETYSMTVSNIIDSLPADIRISKTLYQKSATGIMCNSDDAIKLKLILKHLKAKMK